MEKHIKQCNCQQSHYQQCLISQLKQEIQNKNAKLASVEQELIDAKAQISVKNSKIKQLKKNIFKLQFQQDQQNSSSVKEKQQKSNHARNHSMMSKNNYSKLKNQNLQEIQETEGLMNLESKSQRNQIICKDQQTKIHSIFELKQQHRNSFFQQSSENFCNDSQSKHRNKNIQQNLSQKNKELLFTLNQKLVNQYKNNKNQSYYTTTNKSIANKQLSVFNNIKFNFKKTNKLCKNQLLLAPQELSEIKQKEEQNSLSAEVIKERKVLNEISNILGNCNSIQLKKKIQNMRQKCSNEKENIDKVKRTLFKQHDLESSTSKVFEDFLVIKFEFLSQNQIKFKINFQFNSEFEIQQNFIKSLLPFEILQNQKKFNEHYFINLYQKERNKEKSQSLRYLFAIVLINHLEKCALIFLSFYPLVQAFYYSLNILEKNKIDPPQLNLTLNQEQQTLDELKENSIKTVSINWNFCHMNNFAIFEIEYVAVIYMALLIEKSVLFIGDSQEQISAIIFSFVNLFHPFEWPFPIICNLSQENQILLNSPVPIIAVINLNRHDQLWFWYRLNIKQVLKYYDCIYIQRDRIQKLLNFLVKFISSQIQFNIISNANLQNVQTDPRDLQKLNFLK